MGRITRCISIGALTVTCLVIMVVNTVFAQNLNSIVPVESSSAVSSHSSPDDLFPSAVLVDMEAIERSSLEAPNDFWNYSEESSNYTLGKEDVIEILVLRHPEVSGQFIINSEGKIQYEFIGDIKVEGLKKGAVKELLTNRLSEYIISPDVTVKIIGYNSKIVYVIGEVRAPGKIYMRGDTITVREALVQAGLPLLTGKISQSRLITPSDTGKVEKKMVNIQKLLYEGDLRENLIMNPGDTLYVPPTMMTKAMRVIQPVAAPINSASSTGRRIYTGGF